MYPKDEPLYKPAKRVWSPSASQCNKSKISKEVRKSNLDILPCLHQKIKESMFVLVLGNDLRLAWVVGDGIPPSLGYVSPCWSIPIYFHQWKYTIADIVASSPLVVWGNLSVCVCFGADGSTVNVEGSWISFLDGLWVVVRGAFDDKRMRTWRSKRKIITEKILRFLQNTQKTWTREKEVCY